MESSLQAILVVHGIGQQQPFQPLDSFVNGLRATIARDGKSMTITHFALGRDEVFDHFIRIEAEGSGTAPPLRLDVYEFYWAPFTQGKASFAQVVRWLAITGLTPVRRLAFNLPLLVERGKARAQAAARARARSARVAATPPTDADPGGAKRTKRSGPVTTPRFTFWTVVEFVRELWRLVYVSLVAVGLAWAAAALVARGGELVKKLAGAVAAAMPASVDWPDVLTVAVALIAAIAALGLGVSIPEQMRDLWRLRRVEPQIFAEAGRAGTQELRMGEGRMSRWVAGAFAYAGAAGRAAISLARWRFERRARERIFLPISIAGFLIAAVIFAWLAVPAPGCLGPICPRPIIFPFLRGLATSQDVVVVALILLGAFAFKRVFVDYLADVALYTTADENSDFFATRTAILKEATRRIRFLLQDEQYRSVAIAGHSLGSVIGYDAINWLRMEARLPRPDGTRQALDGIAKLAEKLPAVHGERVKNALAEIDSSIAAESKRSRAGPGGSGGTLSAPITPDALAKLTAFITFGSPLNKVLYFFRRKIKVYETIRAHIVAELHGFRQAEGLLTRDATVQDARAAPVPDKLKWVNVYSPMDPVSARLVLYERVDERRYWYLVWGRCHLSYWHDPRFYRDVLATLSPAPPAGTATAK